MRDLVKRLLAGTPLHAPLRRWAETLLQQAGVTLDGGRIRLLAFPRLFGFVKMSTRTMFPRSAVPPRTWTATLCVVLNRTLLIGCP